MTITIAPDDVPSGPGERRMAMTIGPGDVPPGGGSEWKRRCKEAKSSRGSE
jgi:hypothetical protein